MKVYYVGLLLLLVHTAYPLDFIHNLPKPFTSMNDAHKNIETLEHMEKNSSIDWRQTDFLAPIVNNDVLVQAHSFLSISDLSFDYHIDKTILHVSAFVYQRNTTDDSIVAGHFFWANQTILTDIGFGVRQLFGSLFFVGIGTGVGVYIALKNTVLTELILDRIFLYQEIGLNLRTTSRSILLAVVSVREGLQLQGTPELIARRSNIVNGSIGVKWQYLF